MIMEITMTDMTGYWDAMCPYVDYIENLVGINTRNLDHIYRLMKSPVLVVGAGQGLLVESLRQKGFRAEGVDLSLQMVAYAEKRRGIKLFHANANDMLFQDNQFAASIVATGVIDFLDDDDQITEILNEVKRVTDEHGEIFVGFLGFTPQNEELLRYVGAITHSGKLRMGAIIKKAVYSGKLPIMALGRDLNKSKFGIVLRTIKSAMSVPKARLIAMFKTADDLKKKVKSGELPDLKIFVDSAPEQIPYRNKEQIHKLFKNLNIPLRNTFTFDNCNIVQLSRYDIRLPAEASQTGSQRGIS
jgi:hypothetical protein